MADKGDELAPGELLLATIARRRRRMPKMPVGVLALTWSSLRFEPATMPEFGFDIPLSELSYVRPITMHQFLRVQGTDRIDVFFVTGGSWEEQPPAEWEDGISNELEGTERVGAVAEGASMLGLLPELPFGDLVKVPSVVTGLRRNKLLVDAWSTAIGNAIGK